MKSLYLTFTDKEFKKLEKSKRLSGYKTWNLYLMGTTKGVSVWKKMPKRYELKGGKK